MPNASLNASQFNHKWKIDVLCRFTVTSTYVIKFDIMYNIMILFRVLFSPYVYTLSFVHLLTQYNVKVILWLVRNDKVVNSFLS